MSKLSDCTMADAEQLTHEALPRTLHGLRALLDRLAERVRRRAQAKQDGRIGLFIANNGGRLTDDLEREISRRFGAMAGD
jgi:hypothetical protein